MTWLQKLRIWMKAVPNCASAVDELLEAFMAEGTLTSVDRSLFEARIQYHDKEYAVYLYGDYGMSLRKCLVRNGASWDLVYEYMSPSRKVRVLFWEWLEDYGVTLRSPIEIAEDNIRKIIEEAHHEAQ